MRTAVAGTVYLIKVMCESFGDDAFTVSIDPAPKLDTAIAPSFTAQQGQYLAFIYNYTKIHGQAPAELDMEHYFRVTPPSVYEMIETLERNGLIERTPGRPDPIVACIRPEHLPRLERTAHTLPSPNHKVRLIRQIWRKARIE